MFIKLILIHLLTILSIEAFSQSDFRDGYIIKNNNDTIHGLIDYKGNMANAVKCVFKEYISTSSIEYDPLQIKAYRYTDSKCYISKNVNLNGAEEYRFLEYLINGIVDVFYFRDALNELYFVENEDGHLAYLSNDIKEVLIDDKMYHKESKEYIGILKYTFRDSPSIIRQVDHAALNHESLIKMASVYHSEVCSTEECVVYEKKIAKVNWVFGALTGVNLTFVTFNNDLPDRNDYLKYSSFSNDLFVSFGLFIKANMPNLNERLHFQYEGSYSHRHLETENKNFDKQNGTSYRTKMSLTNRSFNNTVMLRYEFPKGTMRPVFQAGMFANYFYNVEHQATVIISKTNEIQNRDNEYEVTYNPFGNNDYGFAFGTGVIMEAFNARNILLDFRYQKGLGWLRGVSSNTFLLNIGIQINK